MSTCSPLFFYYWFFEKICCWSFVCFYGVINWIGDCLSSQLHETFKHLNFAKYWRIYWTIFAYKYLQIYFTVWSCVNMGCVFNFFGKLGNLRWKIKSFSREDFIFACWKFDYNKYPNEVITFCYKFLNFCLYSNV